MIGQIGDTLPERGGSMLMRDIVDGSVFGTTNNMVLRFNPANDSGNVAGMGTIVHSATLGDSYTIMRRGIYHADLVLSQAAASSVGLGISLNGTVLLGGVEPLITDGGMLDAVSSTVPAATLTFPSCRATFQVTDAQASGAGAILRAQCTNSLADAAIDVNTSCYFRLTYLGDALS